MYHYGIEKGEPPVDSDAQDYDVDEKWHDNVLEKHGMVFNEFPGPERVQEAM
jgi:hypothetical protein